ncbi:MAG: ATP-binding protein [Patescibacteria group bacterium]|nr:ATP-binding protein [Patescibacteria group bacterium]
MAKFFSSSLNTRFLYYMVAIAGCVIAIFVYMIISTFTGSLKTEVQERVNATLETFSIVFSESHDQILTDVESLARGQDFVQTVNTLAVEKDISKLEELSEYVALKKQIRNTQEAQGLSFVDVVDSKGNILVGSENIKVGQKISLKGYVENVIKNKTTGKSVEIITQEEMQAHSEELAKKALINRIPTEKSKQGWRTQEDEHDGLVMAAGAVIINDGEVVGAIIGGALLNNNNEILDRLVQRGKGIASLYLYDARAATTQQYQNINKRAIGTLASEEIVNTVYITQKDFSGRAFELDEWYLVAYQPIRNFENEVIGSIARGIPESEVTSSIGSIRLRFLIIGVGMFVLIYFITRFLVKSITRPLKELAINANRLSHGNLDIDIQPPEREDEIGDLTHSFINMKDKLHEYYTKLEALVAERTQELRQKVRDLEIARHSIEDEKNKSESILQNVGDGVLALNKDKEFIACNEAASDLLDYRIPEIIGKDLDAIINLKYIKLTDKNKDVNPIIKAIETGNVVATGTGEFAVVTKKKKGIPVTITATPLKDPSGEIHGGVVVIKDVTKEQEIDKMKSEFVSVASHQLRTPLSASKWFLEMLMDGDAGKLNKEQSEYIDHITKSNERMIALVNDLLNVSRIESGTIAIEPILTDIDGMIESVIFELAHIIKQKKQKTEFEKLSGGTPQIKIDPKLIRQVFQNLISNAVKYTPEGGKLGVRVSRDAKFLTFEVFDTGVGIPKSQQSKVFKKFFRADNVITLQTEGTGLGLYVAKSVVEASGGKIWFKSEEGKGTNFFFTLPIAGSARREGEKTLI